MPHLTIVAGYYGLTLAMCLSIHRSVVHRSVHPSVFSFPNNLSKYKWILTKLGMCIDIVSGHPRAFREGEVL